MVVVQHSDRPLTEDHHLKCVAVRLNAMKRIQQAAFCKCGTKPFFSFLSCTKHVGKHSNAAMAFTASMC